MVYVAALSYITVSRMVSTVIGKGGNIMYRFGAFAVVVAAGIVAVGGRSR